MKSLTDSLEIMQGYTADRQGCLVVHEALLIDISCNLTAKCNVYHNVFVQTDCN